MLVPRSSRTAPQRRIVGSAFRPGGFALAVAPLSTVVRIPRQQSLGVVGGDRRTRTA